MKKLMKRLKIRFPCAGNENASGLDTPGRAGALKVVRVKVIKTGFTAKIHKLTFPLRNPITNRLRSYLERKIPFD